MTDSVSMKVSGNINENSEQDVTNNNIIKKESDPDISFEPDFKLLSTDSINEINQKVDENLDSRFVVQEELEQTRSQIGKVFVRGFFIFLFLSFIGVIVYNIFIFVMTGKTDLFLDMGNVIPIVGSVIGTPLGFVMGYYFKGEK